MSTDQPDKVSTVNPIVVAVAADAGRGQSVASHGTQSPDPDHLPTKSMTNGMTSYAATMRSGMSKSSLIDLYKEYNATK